MALQISLCTHTFLPFQITKYYWFLVNLRLWGVLHNCFLIQFVTGLRDGFPRWSFPEERSGCSLQFSQCHRGRGRGRGGWGYRVRPPQLPLRRWRNLRLFRSGFLIPIIWTMETTREFSGTLSRFVLDSVLGPLRLARNTWRCPCLSM